MKKQTIKLNESQLRDIIKEAISEVYVPVEMRPKNQYYDNREEHEFMLSGLEAKLILGYLTGDVKRNPGRYTSKGYMSADATLGDKVRKFLAKLEGVSPDEIR